MATTKETMKIIAMGLGETGAREPEDCSDCPLMDALARRASEHFTEMTEEMDEEVILEIVRKLETEACSDEPGAMIARLGKIFVFLCITRRISAVIPAGLFYSCFRMDMCSEHAVSSPHYVNDLTHMSYHTRKSTLITVIFRKLAIVMPNHRAELLRYFAIPGAAPKKASAHRPSSRSVHACGIFL